MKEYTVDCRTFKEKVNAGLEKAKETGKKAVTVMRENTDVIILVMPVVCTVIGGTTKIATKMIQQHNINKEIDFRQRTIYDRSLGRYIELRKPLTTRQAIIIEERRANGERLTSILDSMGLLKW